MHEFQSMTKLSGIAHGAGTRGQATLATYGKANGKAYSLPLGKVANGGVDYVSGFPPTFSRCPPWQWGRIA
jgi:hypothetical protein